MSDVILFSLIVHIFAYTESVFILAMVIIRCTTLSLQAFAFFSEQRLYIEAALVHRSRRNRLIFITQTWETEQLHVRGVKRCFLVRGKLYKRIGRGQWQKR